MKDIITWAFSDLSYAQPRFSLQLLLSLLILSGGLTSTTSAQTITTTSTTDGRTPSALAPGTPVGSYALSGFENINPFNGAVNFHLPLLQVGGRGAAGYTMTLPIEQKWQVKHTVIDYNIGCARCEQFLVTHTYQPTAIWWGSFDSRSKYTPGVLEGRPAGIEAEIPCGSNSYRYRYTLTRLTFKTADGTEYDLRDQLNEGKPLQPTSCSSGPSRGTIFKTADGSSATFISDAPISDYVLPLDGLVLQPSGYLFLKDGTRYRIIDGKVRVMRDRNGNQVEFDYSTGPLIIKDSLNRRITVTVANGTTPYDEISFKGAGGATRTIRVWYGSLGSRLRPANAQHPAEHLGTYRQLFPTLDGSDDTYFDPPVVSAVELPDGRQYQFYYNSYGELAKVRLPTGGSMEYDYQAGDGVLSLGGGPQGEEYAIYRRAEKRRVYRDDNTLESTTEISSHQGSAFLVKQLDQNGQLLSASIHYYYGSAAPSLFQRATYYPGWDEAKEYRTEILAADGQTVLQRVEHTWQQRAPLSWWAPSFEYGPEPANDPRIVATVTTLADANLVSKQTFDYDQYNNQTDVYEYDFGAGAPGPLIRRRHTDYVTFNNGVDYGGDYNIHIRNLPLQTQVSDAGGAKRAETFYEYDNYNSDGFHSPLSDCPNISGHDGAFWAGYIMRGNVTKTSRALLDNNGGGAGWVNSHAQYDVAGNVVKVIDSNGNAAQFDFRDNFGSPGDPVVQSSENPANQAPGELGGQMSYAFPFKITNALGHKAYTKYDYYLGRAALSEDANGVKSNVYFNDALDRPTRGVRAIGTSAASQTVFVYNDSGSPVNGYPARSITTISDKDIFGESNGGNGLKSVALYDGYGRTWRGAAYEGSTWSITNTQFDALGRVSHVSNPYRVADPDSTSAPDGLWTETVYDSLGRVVDVETPDGAHVITQYAGNQVTVVDQAGKRRRSETDALGRLIRVTEDQGNLNYETYYSYDALDNLRVVTQQAQIRTFAYDALSRLISAANPESGTVTYAYDPNGNLIEKTDAREVKTTMTYDALNRVRSKVYTGITSEGTAAANVTPPVNYFYDDYSTLPSGAPAWTGTPSKGRLIGVTYGPGSEGTYYKYDAAGRIATNHQRQGISNYATNYTYNLASGLKSEHRGNYVNNVWKEYFRNSWTYDNAGRLSAMQSSLTPFLSFVPLVGDISYTPFGGLQSETYGNGLIHSIGYNDRLQPTEIRLGSPGNLESVFTIYYMYGIAQDVNDPDPEIAPIHNNGNIARVRYSVSGTIQYAQTFQYDPLNRLRYAVEHNNGVHNDASRAWYQTFEYDRYGNRGINVANTSDNVDGMNTALKLADFSAVNNRITHADYVYDAAGNLIAEPGKSYTYDAENRLVTAAVAGGGTSQYVYDGNGRRVKKIVGGVATRFEYGAGGELIAERNDTNGTVTKGYLYKGGELLATTTNGTAYEYATADHLGTPRAWTDNAGNLVAGGRHDYLPFGEELFAGVGIRTTELGYSSNPQQDGQRIKFDGYERDAETGLDFAQARYYSNIQGRFTSPDSPFADQFEYDPQSWNLYAFVRNNPCANTDPSGRQTCYYSGGSLIGCEGDKRVNVDANAGTLTLTQKGRAPIVYDLNKVDAQFITRSGTPTGADYIAGVSLLAPGMKTTVEGAGIGAAAVAAAPIIGLVNAAAIADTLIDGDTSGQYAAAGVVISPLANDWAQKGAHVKASNGVELAIRPGMNGEIVLKPVFSSTSEAAANTAIKEVREKIARDPAFRQKLANTVERGVGYLGKGSEMARSRSGELRFLPNYRTKV